MNNASAGGGKGKDKGEYGSIGIFNKCSLDGTELTIETTITDKSSGGVEPIMGVGSSVTAQWKARGKGGWKTLGDSQPFVPVLGENTTVIDLCAAGIVDTNAVSLNASVSVMVTNSKKGGYETSRCSDDLSTIYVNESIVNVNGIIFSDLCAP